MAGTAGMVAFPTPTRCVISPLINPANQGRWKQRGSPKAALAAPNPSMPTASPQHSLQLDRRWNSGGSLPNVDQAPLPIEQREGRCEPQPIRPSEGPPRRAEGFHIEHLPSAPFPLDPAHGRMKGKAAQSVVGEPVDQHGPPRSEGRLDLSLRGKRLSRTSLPGKPESPQGRQ